MNDHAIIAAPHPTNWMPSLPAIPSWLTDPLARAMDPEQWYRQPPLAPPAREQVQDLARAFDAALAAPLPPAEALLAFLVEWLQPLNAAVRNPQSKGDFETRMRPLVLALSDPDAGVSAAAFTGSTLSRLVNEFDFWPSSRELVQLLHARTQALKAAAGALRGLGREPTAAAPPRPEPLPTEEEKAAVQHLLDSWDASRLRRAPRGGQEATGRPRPAYAPREQLLARYRAQASDPDPTIAALGKAALDRLEANPDEAEPPTEGQAA